MTSLFFVFVPLSCLTAVKPIATKTDTSIVVVIPEWFLLPAHCVLICYKKSEMTNQSNMFPVLWWPDNKVVTWLLNTLLGLNCFREPVVDVNIYLRSWKSELEMVSACLLVTSANYEVLRISRSIKLGRNMFKNRWWTFTFFVYSLLQFLMQLSPSFIGYMISEHYANCNCHGMKMQDPNAARVSERVSINKENLQNLQKQGEANDRTRGQEKWMTNLQWKERTSYFKYSEEKRDNDRESQRTVLLVIGYRWEE